MRFMYLCHVCMYVNHGWQNRNIIKQWYNWDQSHVSEGGGLWVAQSPALISGPTGLDAEP